MGSMARRLRRGRDMPQLSSAREEPRETLQYPDGCLWSSRQARARDRGLVKRRSADSVYLQPD